MQILVTNDDGILSEGLWTLVKELTKIAEVIVVAPDSEQSAIGTAVTLRQPLKIEKVSSRVPSVAAYSVSGTPSDSVILALGNLVRDKIDVVVSGINHGSNLGDDVHISGTVGAALQGYLRNLPSLAVSVPWGNEPSLEMAARITAILASRISQNNQKKLFLNINLPDVPLADIGSVQITRLARESHVNIVEEDNHGQQKYYRLVRHRLCLTPEDGDDVHAIEQGNISITPLYFSKEEKPPAGMLEGLCHDLLPLMRK